MKDLIEALQIFAKYQIATESPTICSHDMLVIVGVDYKDMKKEDIQWVEAFGFEWDETEEYFYSFRFGSA
jgi:hypothetical protein